MSQNYANALLKGKLGFGLAQTLWIRWVYQGQPIDGLVLFPPNHQAEGADTARQIFHRLLCRHAGVEMWRRQRRLAGLGALLVLFSFLVPSLPYGWSEGTGFLLFLAALAAGVYFLPSVLMRDAVTQAGFDETAGVVRRAFLREVPDKTPADLVDVWRHGWLTSEARPIAAELTEADARNQDAASFARRWVIALVGIAAGVASLAGSYVAAVVALLCWFHLWAFTKYPLVSRLDELEAQEAVEGTAFVTAGGRAWGERMENARTRQLQEAIRDTSPVAILGASTGLLAARGDAYAPSPGLNIGLSLRDLQQHMIVFGGTGSGKTSGILRPIAYQAAEWENVGMVVLDGKGALPGELAGLPGMKVIHPQDERISLLGDLEPEAVVDTMVNLLAGANSNFWIESGAGLLRRAAVIAKAHGGAYWTLSGIAAIAFRRDERKKALDLVEKLPEEVRSRPTLIEAVAYFLFEWPSMDQKTQSNIEATARSWVTTITSHEDLLVWADTRHEQDTIDVMSPLFGGKIGLLVPAHRYGRAGAVVTALLKARIYSSLKERAERPFKPGETPILFIIDEAEEVATSEDATMLAIGRSLGLAVVAATQTVEGVVERLTDKVAQKWLAIFGSAITLSGRSRQTDNYMAQRAGACWRLAIERVHGLPVRTAIGADMTTGVMAASHHQVSLVEAQDMPGSTLAGAAWTRATKPLALILKNIGKGPKQDFGTSLGARPVVETDELQTLLAEPDTALVLLNRGRVPRRDIIKLKPLYPPAVEAPKSDPVAKAS